MYGSEISQKTLKKTKKAHKRHLKSCKTSQKQNIKSYSNFRGFEPKMAPRLPKMAPRWPQERPRRPKINFHTRADNDNERNEHKRKLTIASACF